MALTREGRKAILDHVVTDLGLEIHLMTNAAGGDEEAFVLGDMVEATFDGYAPKSGIVFPASVINGGDQGETLSPTENWTVTGGSSLPQTITGAYATCSLGGTKLMFVKYFAAPVVLSIIGHEVNKKFDFLSDTL